MKIEIPELSLVCLIGASGSGKSTFARKHFKPTEVLSSDYFRGLISDDENDQSVTKEAFETLHFVAAKRLRTGRLTVVDATNVQSEAREPLVALARQFHVIPVAIAFNIPERVCQERNSQRTDRNFGRHVIRQHTESLRRSLRGLEREGFRHLHVLDEEAVAAAEILREPLYNNRKKEHGPFDIVGDVHGCYDELCDLFSTLGYEVDRAACRATPPAGRKAVFVGDLVDRGPKVTEVLRMAMNMAGQGFAFCVPGNHDAKLLRKLDGRDVKLTHGLAQTMEQLEREPEEFRNDVRGFLDSLVSHYVFDDGKLVVAHAGLKEELQGRGSGVVREFALYGETTGETDEYGLPVRLNWAANYRGRAMVVYGHTPVTQPEWLNRTINIDTGCVFGGALTALRYPERELASVPAARVYYEPAKPLGAPSKPALTAQQQADDLLDIDDVIGKRLVETRLSRNITIREENSIAALEVMSRFAVNPKWLIYLPPTMSPPVSSKRPDYLEHPEDALGYFRQEGLPEVVCEQKHMGSRAVVIVGRDEEAIRRRFGIAGEGFGVCYTRTGRRFFTDDALEIQMLERVRAALGASGFWETHKTSWVCLDCELMPWSLKAEELLRQQYAPAGASSRVAMSEAISALERGAGNPDVGALLEAFRERQRATSLYTDAYRRYCWNVASIEDVKLAPFHVLATDRGAHVTEDHVWHMETIAAVCAADPGLLVATPYVRVNLESEDSVAAAVDWWEALTEAGGEGMVVKPLSFIARGPRGMSQPAVKCRGREYLRIIYGPEYSIPANLERLRARSVGSKRSLAAREFALGVESLERFARHEPLRRVHECVFGVLALESEPVDPRL